MISSRSDGNLPQFCILHFAFCIPLRFLIQPHKIASDLESELSRLDTEVIGDLGVEAVDLVGEVAVVSDLL